LIGQPRILNRKGKLKRKIKFIKDPKNKRKIKTIRTKFFLKKTNHNYEFKDKIEKKINKGPRTKIKNKK
jgi:hypothetical protein